MNGKRVAVTVRIKKRWKWYFRIWSIKIVSLLSENRAQKGLQKFIEEMKDVKKFVKITYERK